MPQSVSAHGSARGYARAATVGIAVALAAISPRITEAQWVHSYNGIGQNSGFMQVSTPEPLTAYAVGVQDTGTGNQEAIVIYTHDGGVTWQKNKPSSSAFAFYVSVFSPTTDKAYVGSMGRVFITTTGGLTWAPSGDAGMNTVSGVGGSGEDFAVVTISDGSIFRSTDGGTSWVPCDNPIGDPLAGVFFLNESVGWLSGSTWNDDTGTYEDGSLLRTTDGGVTWEVMFSGESRGINSVSFINPSEGWLVSTSSSSVTLEKTTDGGRTWTALDVPDFSAGAPDTLYDVDFTSRCEGWLVMGTGTDSVTTGFFYTSDGGSSWGEIDMSWAAIEGLPFPIPVRGNPISMDLTGRDAGYCGGLYEFLGRWTGGLPDPGCGGYDPDATTNPDGGGDSVGSAEGCSCSIVW